MKKILTASLIVMIVSCNSEKEKEDTNVAEDTIIDSALSTAPLKPSYNPETALYIWHATVDYKKEKNPALQAQSSYSVDSLIWGLNEYYENVYLEKIKQSGDTIYTAVKDNDFLGNQMGSTGAEVWLADVVLNLTSVPGIRYVHIDMQEANHIEPGTWSADNFKKYKEAVK